MEKQYEQLKNEVGEIFFDIRDIIFNTPEVDKNKIEMNLKIIQAVVMRFIRMVIYKRHKGILCTSPNEIIRYATNGFLTHIPQEDGQDREKIRGYVDRLQMLLKIEKMNKADKTLS